MPVREYHVLRGLPNAMTPKAEPTARWYVMRDLKRPNAKMPAYRQLSEAGMEVFTPMRQVLKVRNGRRIRESVPFIRDLLFVRETRAVLDPVVAKTPTLQYRYRRGGEYREPLVVADEDMDIFMRAVACSSNPRYYQPQELTPSMYGCMVRVIGGTLDGYEGRLLSVRGSRTKRLLVELPDFVTAAVEADFEFVLIAK